MVKSNKLLQALGIPFASLVSVIFGLMILSFPVGAYVVFNSTIEKNINFDYPISLSDLFSVGKAFEIPLEFELGDGFIVIWCTFVVLFTIAMFGPKSNFLKSLLPIMTEGKHKSKSNYLVAGIKWFAILILVSMVINFVQDSFGIKTESPQTSNILLRFFDVSLAPLTEEIAFRVVLIGIPLFAMYAHRSSFGSFFKALWHPSENLQIKLSTRVLVLIVVVGVLFGAAHVISGEPWSSGKFAQATVSGIIIGWVYFRYGFISAVIVHWATNYFIFSYIYLIADINDISIQNAFSHSLAYTMEILFVLTGIVAIAIIIVNYVNLKKEKKLEV